MLVHVRTKKTVAQQKLQELYHSNHSRAQDFQRQVQALLSHFRSLTEFWFHGSRTLQSQAKQKSSCN